MREIVLAWRDAYPEDELTMVTRTRDSVGRRPDVPSSVAIVESRLWPQAFFARSAVRRAAKKTRADAVLTHNFAAQATNAASCVYLHDVLFLTNPEWFTPFDRLYFSLMARWVESADIVVTSSRSEARRIADHTSAGFVLPVGLGLNPELTDPVAPDDVDPTLTAGRFLLTASGLSERGNLERIVLAALDKGLLWAERPLVVIGEPSRKPGVGEVDRRVTNAMASGVVVFTGAVSEERTRWLYRNTSLFVFLPLGEGYGMPTVEAAYFGAPILASELEALRENLGSFAEYVEPTDVAAIGEAMSVALRSGGGHAEQLLPVEEGLAATHDWRATVAAIRSSMAETKAEVLA
jgi:glycosyltransferase involved in cell wall biosynthesis